MKKLVFGLCLAGFVLALIGGGFADSDSMVLTIVLISAGVVLETVGLSLKARFEVEYGI